MFLSTRNRLIINLVALKIWCIFPLNRCHNLNVTSQSFQTFSAGKLPFFSKCFKCWASESSFDSEKLKGGKVELVENPYQCCPTRPHAVARGPKAGMLFSSVVMAAWEMPDTQQTLTMQEHVLVRILSGKQQKQSH